MTPTDDELEPTEALATIATATLGTERFLAESERAGAYASRAKAEATKRAYRSDWRRFAAYCDERDRQALPATAETVAGYIAHLADAGRKPATIGRHMVSINKAHELAGFSGPARAEALGEVWQGIRRTLTIAQDAKAP